MSKEYEKNSGFQKQCSLNILEKISTVLKEAAQQNPERFNRSDEPFTIADLGCADGKNSLPILETIITLVREINPKLPIQIYLNDTPDCDLSAAMKTVNQKFEKLPLLWVYSLGKSFYGSLMPQKTVDLMFSTTAIHWIPKVVCELPHFVCILTDDTTSSTEGKLWKNAAAGYWEMFLNERENELKFGGILFLLCPALAEVMTADDLRLIEVFLVSKECVKKSLSNNSLEYYEEYCPPIVIRALDHFQAPFKEKITNLQWFDHLFIKTPLFQPDQDPRVCSTRYTGWVKGFYEEVFRGAMKSRGVNEVFIQKVIEELFAMFIEQFTKFNFDESPLMVNNLFFILINR